MIYGTPGKNLEDGQAGLDRSRRIVGRAGELATAAVLRRLEAAHPEMAVSHSLRVPARKMNTDIDHVVAAGRRVWVLDSKCWQPGFYWSAGPLAMRGLHRAPYAKRRSMAVAARVLQGYLGTSAAVEVPHVVAWPSSPSQHLSVWAWRPVDARPITGERFGAVARRIIKPAPADAGVVEALARLVIG